MCRGLALGACLVGGAAAFVVACIAAPPTLPALNSVPPIILHASVVPSANGPLVDWPEDGVFIVPVEVEGPDQSFYYGVFIDYDPTSGSDGVAIFPITPVTANGGIANVQFKIPMPPDPRFCHTIEFLAARDFDHVSPHTPDSLGGDIVTWWYTAGGGGPNGCPIFDAGALQTGAFPMDAGADGLPVASASSSL